MKFNKSAVSAIIILVALMTIIGLSGFNYLFGNGRNQSANVAPHQKNNDSTTGLPQPLAMEKISFITEDKVKIAGDLYGVKNPAGWLVLVHMMPATKESYTDLAQRFQNLGYESLAIDLRGHGESDMGPNGYLNFSDSDNQKSILDLESAADYLTKNRGATQSKIIFIGASIGANLSLQYISEHQEYKIVILLSAGLNYRGIKTEPLVKNLKAGQKVFFISSRDDDNNASENQTLYDLTSNDVFKKIKIYDSGGHGTDILNNQSDLMELIIEFIG